MERRAQTPQRIVDDEGVELHVEVRDSTEGLDLSEPAWPHADLKTENGRARIAALVEGLGLRLRFDQHRLGLPEGAEWRFVGPDRWALLCAGRVAFEV